MVWKIASKSRRISPTILALRPLLNYGNSFQCSPFSILTNFSAAFTRSNNHVKTINPNIRVLPSVGCERITSIRSKSSSRVSEHPQVAEERVCKTDHDDSFGEMRQRFLNFKKHKYLKDIEYYKSLAEVQTPKFMVIACSDSRVCPSNILGFQPGEAFMIRNVANLVPPVEKGSTETNAALEFAVNVLEVENILVIGHSACRGIEALMSMHDGEKPSGYISDWITKGNAAKFKTKAKAAHLSFEQQCRHCEKESINCSLLNLLTYPWIEDRVKNGLLSLYGGYYDMLNCKFEKWRLDVNERSNEEQGNYSVKDRELWR